MKAPTNGFLATSVEGEQKNINSELWHACAGPLVSLPPVGSLVVYFPQGHSEQVAASMQKETDFIPNYPNLPSKLICLLHNVTLHADTETDEVYAQMTLQPVNKYDKEAILASDMGLKQSRQPSEFFCKTLTASDTSTHGGFSVPRRAAEKIFPPLDFTMQPPAQELVAKDLHDSAWTFRHIYRGQPKRHLLTTGWSVFVSTKRLFAGDAVLFIRDEKSQLLLGIRRANRQQPALSSSVISSDSMHIGILAAAAHAAANNSPFTIFYNPRASPSEFVVPLAKYNKAMYTQVSLGMRFRMMFETEESGVRRYMGTITGISELDHVRWKSSQWRNLQVGWDESTAGDRPSRVSIWEIEPVVTPFYICPPPFFRPKFPKQPGMPDDESDIENAFKRAMPWLGDEFGMKNSPSSIFPGLSLVQWMNMQQNNQFSAPQSGFFPSMVPPTTLHNGTDDPSKLLNFQAPGLTAPGQVNKAAPQSQVSQVQQPTVTWPQQQQLQQLMQNPMNQQQQNHSQQQQLQQLLHTPLNQQQQNHPQQQQLQQLMQTPANQQLQNYSQQQQQQREQQNHQEPQGLQQLQQLHQLHQQQPQRQQSQQQQQLGQPTLVSNGLVTPNQIPSQNSQQPMMFTQHKALVKLDNVEYEWYQPFKNSNKMSVGLLWLPVVLIYLMDMQIWYAIYSSFWGALVGLLAHLGEIRNIQQLRLRFQFFASAIQFNLMPEEQMLNARGTLRSKFNDAIHRLKLRYGLGQPYKKLESNQIEATKFALIWNEIILIFREEDLISDCEVELLELPQNSWNVRVIRWPCFLLCNELLLALSQAKELIDAPDKWLWYKICKNEYRRCAVIEAYDCIKHLILAIIKTNTEEHSIVTVLFQEIDHSIQIEKFTKTFKTTALPQLHAKLIKLSELLNKPKKDTNQVVNTLQALYEIAIRDFFKEKRSTEQLIEDGLALRDPSSAAGLLFENAVGLPDPNDGSFYRQVRRLHTILTSRDSMQNIPVNLEARRRIAFFSNSLFMNIPHAPQVEKMMAFSVLTPYYSEEVLYSKEQLRTENEDGISTLYYLQTIYVDEWKNFMERMRREGIANDDEIWTTKLRELRLWASYRGQTLTRTVRGMMYYFRALKMLAFLDSASEMDIREGSQEVGSMMRDIGLDGLTSERSPSSRSLSRTSSCVNSLYKGHEVGTVLMKYTYVVACQIYGTQKAKKDPHADEILYLMKTNEALRIAYVDEVSTGRDEKEYYSVLVKYDNQLEKEVEIYRIKLPGPLKLGEGKPENQNHAIIFTRGDAVQTIDMNQDNYFEEALKMRNLLEEYRRYYGIRKPTILGVREHVFTGSVSSLAWFMSAQETSFVTLGQRVLANPLKIRMHYGHPDVFDRFWFLTRGGISKASRVINISEDIFAGFNCTLRGGNVTHHEYIQVGKGRDVGFNQISMFEAKVASGNGEQVLSRDVYRLGHRLDFLRMLSFFYTTVGFFFNTMMVILTVYAFLWGRLYLALSGIEGSILGDDTSNRALGTVLNQQFIIQLGLFTALPMIVENSLEHGFLQAIWDFLTMQLQLSSVFYTFSMGTRTHYFGRTILHGGAKYRATGRGFVVQHKSFAENYRLYARSHFVKAIELGLILTVYAAYSPVAKDSFVYIAMTITSWFMVLSWFMAPFVFNPSGFDWLKTVDDFDDFMNWIWYRGSVFAKAEQSWERWWYEEQDHLRTTGVWGKLLEIILDLRFFFFQYGIVYQLGIADNSRSILVYLLSWIYVFLAFGIFIVIVYARVKYAAKDHIYYRLVQFLVIKLALLVIIALLEFTNFRFMDIFTSLLAFIPTGWGLILIAQVFRPLLQRTILWEIVVSVARLYDILFGVIVLTPVAVLSWFPGFQSMQTRILFNDAFSRGLRIFQIVTGKKKSKTDS